MNYYIVYNVIPVSFLLTKSVELSMPTVGHSHSLTKKANRLTTCRCEVVKDNRQRRPREHDSKRLLLGWLQFLTSGSPTIRHYLPLQLLVCILVLIDFNISRISTLEINWIVCDKRTFVKKPSTFGAFWCPIPWFFSSLTPRWLQATLLLCSFPVFTQNLVCIYLYNWSNNTLCNARSWII